MHQIIRQSKSPCWHTSGWNEKSNQRKKRKKRDKLILLDGHCSIERSRCPYSHQAISTNTLPRMKILSLIMMPIILLSLSSPQSDVILTNCQVIVEHPRSYGRITTPAKSFSFLPSNPPVLQQKNLNEGSKSIPRPDISEEHSTLPIRDFPSPDNIANYSTMPSSREKEHELLRKLSSTMLLDTLLRNPILTNKSPFPSLSMFSNFGGSFESGINKQPYDGMTSSNTKSNSTQKDVGRLNGTRKNFKVGPPVAGAMDVSTTNRTTITHKNSPSIEFKNLMPIETESPRHDTFNASSLNYLVDKLLSVQPFKHDMTRKRPHRRKSPYENIAAFSQEAASDQSLNTLPTANNSPITLDVLIRDEYNSRVEPMLKSLMDQRRLSSPYPSYKNASSPSNHRLDVQTFDNDISASTSPSNVDRRKNNQLTTTDNPTDPSIHNTIVAFGDIEDLEDDEEFDDELDDSVDMSLESDKVSLKGSARNKTKSSNELSDKKVVLQNVPPYQLGNNLGHQIRGSRYPLNGLNSSQSEIQTTTMSSIDKKHAQDLVSDDKKKMPNLNEKFTDASLRDSLVFSDLADEDRDDRRRNHPNRTESNTDTESVAIQKKRKEPGGKSKGGSRHNERTGESFLLDLFSTINPLTDLDKLKENYNQRDANDRNPLIYKGYVGKDDYLLSTTARDWSRPLNNRDAATPPALYKYMHNNQQPDETIPVTPPSEPPMPPYTSSYFPNQPVTNAQSVPTMVIPTSDPPEMTTTPQPQLSSGFEPSRRKIHLPNNQFGGYSRSTNNHLAPYQHGINALLQNSQLKPLERQQIFKNHDRKYSYQIPDRLQNKTRHQQMIGHTNLPSTDRFRPLLNDSSESQELTAINGGKNITPSSKMTTIVEVDRNWSPSKIIQNSQQDQKRLRTQNQNSPQDILIPGSSPMNLSSPMLVPFVGMKSFGSTPLTNTIIQSQGKVSPVDVSTVIGIENIPVSTLPPTMRPLESTAKPTSVTNGLKEIGDHQERPPQKNFTHTERRSNNFQRNKLKPSKKETSQEPSVTDPSEIDDSLGDKDSEQVDGDNRGSNSRKSKRPTNKHRNQHEKPDSDESELADDYQGESGDSSDEQITTSTHRPKKQSKDRTRASSKDQQQHGMNEQVNGEDLKQNQTNKVTSYGSSKHDEAGSEISLVGFEKNLQLPTLHRRNQTTRFIGQKQQPPQVNTETITLSGSEGDGISYKPASGSDSSSAAVPTSFGSTIIPNSNFVGEASSDSPTLDNSIPAILNGRPLGKIQKQPPHISTAVDDAYQRISSSNNIVSTVLQPSSKVVVTTNMPKSLEPSSTTTEVYRKPEDSVGNSSGGGKSANDPVISKPSSKGTSDRLAFILICGSCFLSVVCLVLAAMSVRCPDMFDDYRYMRNAEKAALRLQKHRLRYTKNHQINRYSDGSSPENIGPNLIDDLNIHTPNAVIAESELNHMRNSTKCLNSRPTQFNPAQCKNTTDATNAIWNQSSSQQHLPGLSNKDQPCRCANCSNQRWSYQQEDLMAANKHLSWLHPYFYMQNHARLRPLFGAGSSVGTFFPRRMDDQKLHTAGGSIDAQILIDSQPPHSCGIIDQRGAARSKSILNTSKKTLNQRHVNGLGVSQHDTSNFGCNNPGHGHSHHDCHNHGASHHHHLHHHRCNLETSTSDGSELTIDDSFHHCDSAKCSAHHQKTALNNRLKLNQLRSADIGHTHHSAIWKPRSFRKSTQSSHHHLHHHHQPMSGSDASSSAQCTCSKDMQPLLQASSNARHSSSHRTSHKRLLKHDTNFKQGKRDKSMLVWSTNLDRLI